MNFNEHLENGQEGTRFQKLDMLCPFNAFKYNSLRENKQTKHKFNCILFFLLAFADVEIRFEDC